MNRIKAKRQHFWWWPEPLVLPRWTLYVTYGLLTLLGVLLTFDPTGNDSIKTIDNALGPWGWAIALIGAACFVSAWIPAHPGYEVVFAGILFSLMFAYIADALADVFQGDWDAAERIVLVLLASAIPIFRVITQGDLIIRRWAKKHDD